MTEYEVWFHETFGEPLPIAFPRALVRRPGESMWVSELHEALTPSALMIPTFVDEPRSYVATGLWGHGMTSQAFYWTSQDEDHRCFFRLPFGGPYADSAAEIVSFLRGWQRWRETMMQDLLSSEIVYSMANARARIAYRGVQAVFQETDVPRMPNGAVMPARAYWPWLETRLRAHAA